jgi:hypothetical protein
MSINRIVLAFFLLSKLTNYNPLVSDETQPEPWGHGFESQGIRHRNRQRNPVKHVDEIQVREHRCLLAERLVIDEYFDVTGNE